MESVVESVLPEYRMRVRQIQRNTIEQDGKSWRFLESTLFNHFLQSVKATHRMDIEMDIDDIWDP